MGTLKEGVREGVDNYYRLAKISVSHNDNGFYIGIGHTLKTLLDTGSQLACVRFITGS